MTQRLRILAVLPGDPGSVLSIAWWLTAICNVLFWTPVALYTCGTETSVLENTQTQIQVIKIFLKNLRI